MMRRLSSSEAINRDKGAWFGVEEVLRKTDRFEYPTSKDVYLDWAAVLRSEYQSIYPEISNMRAEICEVIGTGRLRAHQADGAPEPGHAPLYLWRTLGGFLDLDLPLLISREDDRDNPMYLTGRAIADTGYMFSIYEVDRDFNLMEFFLNRSDGCFYCPFAESATLCKARVARCQEPFHDLRALPDSTGCLVRSSLQSIMQG